MTEQTTTTAGERFTAGDRRSEWPIGTLREAADLARAVRIEEAERRFGAAFTKRMLDGMLTANDGARAVHEDIMARRASREMVIQALDHGIESVDDPPESLVALFAEVDHVPDWSTSTS